MRVPFLRKVDAELLRASREARKGIDGLGPGLITGVADDDPSGISTYTITGASLGYRLLWLSLITLPMNVAVQGICARLGLVTGKGLASIFAERYGRGLLYPIVALLLVANIVNIGADIGAIAASIELLTDLPAVWLVVPIGAGIALVEVVVPYPRFASYLKLLTLVVFAYVIGAFVAHPHWGAALRSTVVPRIAADRDELATIVAILGTTISPYLFFWQASEEVEEEQAHGIEPARVGPSRLHRLLRSANADVATGMLMANVGFYFVVLTSAATLYASGQTDVETASQAAEALRPLAGDAASLLFALGIIGTGLLAIPVLAGASAYATAELFGWREGLNNTLKQAPQFYGVIAVATLVGIGLNFSGVSEIRALYLAAIVNGVIAPLLLVFIMLMAADRRVLGDLVSGNVQLAFGWLTTIAMGIAAIAMFATLVV
jgi:NRAMP (natural resistance-associated macrophage protein)-like metal ion transporter